MAKIVDKKIIVTSAEIAKELNVAQKYISELVRDHGMPKLKHNQFDLVEVLRWFVDYKIDEKNREIEKLKRDDPIRDVARKNARLKEIDIAEKENQIIYVDELMPAWLTQIKVIVQKMDGYIPKVAPKLKAISNVAEIKKILQLEMDNLKEQISKAKIL